MTTCKCRETESDALVMSRDYLRDLNEHKSRLARRETIEEIIELLQVHQNLWFAQSLQAQMLSSGKDGYWSNKSATTQALITEIRKKLS